METKYSDQKHTMTFMLIAGIWLLFSCIFIINAANEGKIYDTIANNQQPDPSSPIGQKIMEIENTLQADTAIEQQKYEQALKLISGTSSQDYYNRGTIQTILAYKNALQTDISWLETAQVFIAQAQQNFDLAEKLSASKNIRKAIEKNRQTVYALTPVIDIKTCYRVGQSIISDMSQINTIISAIDGTLKQEEITIEKNASKLNDNCYQKLRTIVDKSKEQVGELEMTMRKSAQTYKSDFQSKIEDPMICIETPYENILPSLIKGAQWLSQYQSLHQSTIEAIQSNNRQSIQDLCNQTKNDAQINEQITSSVQEMLEKISQNTQQSQEQKQQTKAGQQTQYKDFFSEDEKEVLEQIQKINKWWINNVLKIRSKNSYNAEKYLDELFNQFYGNTGDFIDLHK